MVTQSRLLTRTATHDDLHKLANLTHFEALVHRHLDYRPPLDWIGQHPFCVLERYGEIVASLACPPDPPQIAWIRLFAASNRISVEKAWEALWPFARAQLEYEENLAWVTAIPMHHWFASLLEKSFFQQSQSVILLRWEAAELPTQRQLPTVTIRPMTLDDLSAAQKVDQSAFTPVWQNSLSYLKVAFRQAIIATVAETEDGLVGYQISTETPIGGHLARLAVYPSHQGQGIGFALLHDLLTQFMRRGTRTVTVNTQKDNRASLSLYNKAGFQSTGEEYPFYQLAIG